MDPTFGPYRLVSLLGRGGMGEVWRAEDTDQDDRTVALKILGSRDEADDAFANRFLREARLVASLSDPHIVPIHRYGRIDDRLYIDMQLVDGVDLERLLQSGPPPVRRGVGIVVQVAKALDTAHRAGLVHRDVKPSNILIRHDRDDHTYLIDFGIATARGSTRMTNTGTFVGTARYMAPERFSDRGDERADVYSLACVLFEVVTGRPPFTVESHQALINAHLNAPIPRPSEADSALPAALDEVVARGMAKDPDDRFRTATELAAAARAAVSGDAPPETEIGPPRQQSVRPDPSRGEAVWVARARVSLEGGKPRLARELAERGLAGDPDNARGQWVLGRAHLALDDVAAGRDKLRLANDLDETDAQIAATYVECLLGHEPRDPVLAYRTSPGDPAARRAFVQHALSSGSGMDEAYRIDPDNTAVAHRYAVQLVLTGNPDDIIRGCRLAPALAGDDLGPVERVEKVEFDRTLVAKLAGMTGEERGFEVEHIIDAMPHPAPLDRELRRIRATAFVAASERDEVLGGTMAAFVTAGLAGLVVAIVVLVTLGVPWLVASGCALILATIVAVRAALAFTPAAVSRRRRGRSSATAR